MFPLVLAAAIGGTIIAARSNRSFFFVIATRDEACNCIQEEKKMGHQTLIQSVVSTSYGAMGFYLFMGVVILVAGWALDSIIGPKHKA